MTEFRAEVLGDAIHHAAHPGHEWSGCPYPDKWYDVQGNFERTLRTAGYALTPLARLGLEPVRDAGIDAALLAQAYCASEHHGHWLRDGSTVCDGGRQAGRDMASTYARLRSGSPALPPRKAASR